MNEKYFLRASWQKDWQEVTKEEWIKAERSAGFRPKMAYTDENYMKVCATGGFSNGMIDGRIDTPHTTALEDYAAAVKSLADTNDKLEFPN